MKYNTISTSSLASEGKKATFTIYADMDIARDKAMYSEKDMASIRGELEIVQRALKLQTKRCRQLVAEYTRRLQEKELQYQSEKSLRDDQLAKVLKALLIFEARLRQEQKYISSQLNEKDYIIKKQSNDIKKLLASQYCKNCSQYYTSSPLLESLDSSSDYVITDYQSSNFESMDSSSETYATVSEKGYTKSEADLDDKTDSSNKNLYQKNRNNKDSLGRRTKKIPHRKSVGTYFEVLKLRNESPISNEDNTSADYDNLDSLPSESVTDKISFISEGTENILNKSNDLPNCSESSPNVSISECNNTVIDNSLNNKTDSDNKMKEKVEMNEGSNVETHTEEKSSKITETIPVFEGDNNDGNENWYASASDQEDEERRDIYRNNPVLECMNQILLQNMNDSMRSPPKTPNIERKSIKNKKVKFSDEDPTEPEKIVPESTPKTEVESNHNYYETPIQKPPNFYETPQSIYSNDYEQILSKCSETFSSSSEQNDHKTQQNRNNHHYVDMENPIESNGDGKIVRKSKILRAPPALPPKPPNLVSKYKIQNYGRKTPSEKSSSEFEPDYCSISELNLPQNKNISFKKINVIAEINAPTSHDVMNRLNSDKNEKKNDDYDPVIVKDNLPNLVVKKCVEKLNIQMAKQTPIKSEITLNLQPSPVKKSEPDIPKLPQVSEIIIPDEEPKKEERITHDNYVKNNSQIMKLKTTREASRKPVVMGSSVSSIINGFNNHQILSEIKKKHEKSKVGKSMFSSFENAQNLDKHTPAASEKKEASNFDTTFDLSQNFEEFKLDDCEIEEYNVEDELNEEEKVGIRPSEEKIDAKTPSPKSYSTRVELIRATNDSMVPNLNKNSIDMLKKQLELQKMQIHTSSSVEQASPQKSNEPTYEHFLECTGLSTKSILTPSRLVSNHKSMLKPKDVKLRSKVKASNNLFERHSSGNAIKYWSEPYV